MTKREAKVYARELAAAWIRASASSADFEDLSLDDQERVQNALLEVAESVHPRRAQR